MDDSRCSHCRRPLEGIPYRQHAGTGAVVCLECAEALYQPDATIEAVAVALSAFFNAPASQNAYTIDPRGAGRERGEWELIADPRRTFALEAHPRVRVWCVGGWWALVPIGAGSLSSGRVDPHLVETMLFPDAARRAQREEAP